MAAGAGAGAGADTSLLFPFVFVGCWNQPGGKCGGEGGREREARDTVAADVGKQTDIKYIVLGGDNVYPLPGNKEKRHDPAVFDQGIALYEATGKPILLTFGNHNVDTLNHQKSRFGLTKTYYHKAFERGIHILVLDTNIILNGPTYPEYGEMHDWFSKEVATLSADQHYFVVQHEPYFTARFKKEKDNFGALVNADPFLDIMFARPPIAVLCADTHHYQHATIQQKEGGNIIHQFIVGTGGANHDPHAKRFIAPELLNYKYLFTRVNPESESVNGFGFLRINGIDPSNPDDFKFIKVCDWPLRGGAHRRRSRRRRSNKYRKSQKNTHKRR
jgi:hypothetical protein